MSVCQKDHGSNVQAQDFETLKENMGRITKILKDWPNFYCKNSLYFSIIIYCLTQTHILPQNKL